MKQFLLTVLFVAMAFVSISAQAQGNERSEDFVAGRAALEDGFYQVAAVRLENYVEFETVKEKKANAALLLFRAWYGQGEYQKIIDWLEDNQKISRTDDFRAGFSYWHAQASYALGNYEEAIDDLKRFERKFSDSEFAPFALRLLALSFRDSGGLNDSEKVFVRINKKYPDRKDTPDNLLDWAGVLIQMGDVEEAESLLESLVEKYDGTAPARHARLWLGQAAQERRAPKQASDWLTPLTEDQSVDDSMRANAWLALARTDVDRGRITNALHALVQGERLSTNLDRRVEARIDQARLLMQAGELEDAVDVLDETVFTLASQPQAALAQRELSDLLRAQGLYAKAVDAYQRYLESFSDVEGQRHALLSKAWCLWELNRYPESALAFERAYNFLDDQELREQALVKAADSYFKNSQYKLAAETYGEILAEYPDTESKPELLFQIAESHARAEETTGAVASLERVIELYGNDDIGMAAMLRLARFHEEHGKSKLAIDTYESFLEEYEGTPRESQAMLELSMLYYRLGQYKRALDGFENVLELFPASSDGEKAFFMRGWCRYQLGDVEAAIETGREFLGEYTNSVWATEVTFWLAEHEFNAANYGQAETNFLSIVELNPESGLADDALYWAGRSAVEQKAYRRAIDAFTFLTRQYTNSPLIPEVRFAQGDALTEIGDFAGAILAFEEIVNLYSGSPLVARAIGRIGDCQFTLGSDRPARYQEALASFRTAMTHPGASRNLALQAEYKLARAYERLGRVEDAVTHNLNVVYDWLAARDSGVPVDELWFVRSAFAAAKLKEKQFAWNDAIAIYRRVVDSNITASEDAVFRINQILGQLQKAGATISQEATTVP